MEKKLKAFEEFVFFPLSLQHKRSPLSLLRGDKVETAIFILNSLVSVFGLGVQTTSKQVFC